MSEVKLNRKELMEKDVKDIQNELEAAVVAYSEEINAIDNIEELKKREEALMEEFKEDDEYLKSAEYELGDDVEYDNRKVKRSEIIAKIVGFLNRIEVDFRSSLGIYQGIRYWKTQANGKIPYPIFDNTIRLLGTLKFRGEQDCFDILVVNNWFAAAHDAYIRDNAWTNYLAALHQTIMTRMETLEKTSTATPDAAV